MHGKTSLIRHDGRTVFSGLESPLEVGRYHSLVIDPATVPACLEVSATSEEGEIMAVRHRTLRVEGVQFHPESVLTPAGRRILYNFVTGEESGMRVKEGIDQVISGKSLSQKEAEEMMRLIMEGEATPAQISALVTGLRLKGETVDEIAGFARAMRRKVTQVAAPAGHDRRLLRHRRRQVALVQRLDGGGLRRGRRRACASPSTATARSPRSAAAPTCSPPPA